MGICEGAVKKNVTLPSNTNPKIIEEIRWK